MKYKDDKLYEQSAIAKDIQREQKRAIPLTYEEWFENDVFTIFIDYDGEKKVHFYGYGYYADDSSKTPYRFLEYIGFIYPLKDVLYMGFVEFEGEYQDSVKQFMTDCTEEEMIDIYNHYDEGNMPTKIWIDEITPHTPCGCYILMRD